MPGGRLGQRIVHRRVGRLCTLGADGEGADTDCDVNGVGQRIAGDQPGGKRTDEGVPAPVVSTTETDGAGTDRVPADVTSRAPAPPSVITTDSNPHASSAWAVAA